MWCQLYIKELNLPPRLLCILYGFTQSCLPLSCTIYKVQDLEVIEDCIPHLIYKLPILGWDEGFKNDPGDCEDTWNTDIYPQEHKATLKSFKSCWITVNRELAFGSCTPDHETNWQGIACDREKKIEKYCWAFRARSLSAYSQAKLSPKCYKE